MTSGTRPEARPSPAPLSCPVPLSGNGVGAAGAGAEGAGAVPYRSADTVASGSGPVRRGILRSVFGVAVVAGTTAALAPVLRARRRTARGPAQEPDVPEAAGRQVPPHAWLVDEMYRGRHIQIAGQDGVADAAVAPVPSVSSVAGPAQVSRAPIGDVRIDGRPLHVMRRADGSYLSSVNHYESFATLLEVVRAAVDDLGTARLSRSGPIHHV